MMAEGYLYQLCRIYPNAGFKVIECGSKRRKNPLRKKSKEYLRDRQLIKESQYVLVYTGDDRNADKLRKYAKRKGKIVLELYKDI